MYNNGGTLEWASRSSAQGEHRLRTCCLAVAQKSQGRGMRQIEVTALTQNIQQYVMLLNWCLQIKKKKSLHHIIIMLQYKEITTSRLLY